MRAQPYRRERRDPAVQAVMDRLSRDVNSKPDLLPILTAVQKENRGALDQPRLGAVADALATNDGQVYGVASFYSMLSTRARPAKTLRICKGPGCRLQGSR